MLKAKSFTKKWKEIASFTNWTQTKTKTFKKPDPNFADLEKNLNPVIYQKLKTRLNIYPDTVILEKIKTRIQIFREKLDLVSYQIIFAMKNMFGTPVQNI